MSLFQAHEDLGTTVFLLGRATESHGLGDDARRIIEGNGFEVLKDFALPDRAAIDWPVDGAPPARMLIAFDVLPGVVEDEMRQRTPDLDNGHTSRAALSCREFVRYRTGAGQEFEPMRPSHNSTEAWSMIRQVSPHLEEELRQSIASIKAAMVTDFEVVRDLTRGAPRAKIEVIRYGDGLAVKKTYRGSRLHYMEREISFMDAFSADRPEIPPVLQRGANYFIMPFVNGRPLRRFLFGRSFPRLMTLKQVRNIADLLRFVFAHGYDPIDLGPHNLLVDEAGRIKAIDFEFAHKSDGPIDPERSACLAGLSEEFTGEWPLRARLVPHLSKLIHPWPLRWRGTTGLTLKSFLYDPPWLQRAKRAVIYPTYLAGKAAGQLLEPLRRVSRKPSTRP
jgi:hypothetical protein